MTEKEIISSNNNPLVKRLAKLSDAKYRRDEELFLCEGVKLSAEALSSGNTVRYLLIREGFILPDELYTLTKSTQPEIITLADAPFSKISTEQSPQGIIAVADTGIVSEFSKRDTGARIFLADGVRDPGNLGTMIRGAAAMGFDTLVMSDCADVCNPKTVRASMGGIFRIKLRTSSDMKNTVTALRENGRRVFAAALSDNSKSLGSFELLDSDAFLVGNEGHGLSGELIESCTGCVRIDMAGGTESLNVSGAATILMWEMSKTFITKKTDN